MSLRRRIAWWFVVGQAAPLAVVLGCAFGLVGEPVAATVLALAFGLAWALLSGHVLTRNLAELADTADEIAAGNTETRAALAGTDEVGRLARALNSIVDHLETHLARLQDSHARLIKPTEAMSEGFALWDGKDRLLLYNQQFCKILAPIACSIRQGMKFTFLAHLISDCLLMRTSGFDGQDWVRDFTLQHRSPRGMQEIHLHNGRWISIYEFRTPEDEVVGIYSDITERKQRELALRQGRHKLRVIMNAVVDGILTVGADSMIETCNRAAGRIFGLDEEDLLGRRLDRLVKGISEQEEEGLLSVEGLAILPEDQIVEMTGQRADGSVFPIEISVTKIDLKGKTSFIVTVRDITSRKASEETIRYQATHDALTDLPNRSMFDQRLRDALELAHRHHEMLGVMFLDLDRFKMVNDSLGHSVGDALLVGFGKRIRDNIRAGDIVGRMGGDEFILILREVTCREDAANRAQRLLEAIRPPFHLEGHELHVTASIGISLFPDDGRTAEQLLKTADLALYRAKDAGRNRMQLFNPVMDTVQAQIHLETELRRALEQNQFSLAYQPQIDVRTGRFVGVEALARWRHPEMGAVSPERFIPLAEETGLIHELGLWVLRTACQQHRRWQEAGLDRLRLAVNLSACQLQRAGLEEAFALVFEETGMDLGCLELELTESVLMRAGETVDLVERWTRQGISIALDDFGTGYSSLSYLQRFPIDRIKIDRSFVREIDQNGDNETIARGIIGMARGLDIQVVAEGVENGAQLALLQQFGCHEVQGYFLGEPMPGNRIPEFKVRPIHHPAPAALADDAMAG
jgi:diguanylate cyclase (GGDEF)-like protein/PAS domain S-box-containing protein